MRNGKMKSVRILWTFRQEHVKRLAPRHDGVKYAIPVLHLYWRTENSNEWILLRCDADYLFNCNYTGGYIWDETTNYVKVMPQSWH